MFQSVMLELTTGSVKTLEIFFLTLLGALPLGLLISFGSMSKITPIKAIVKTIVWIIRGTPLMLQLIIVYYGPGLILGTNVWGMGTSGRFIAVIVAFIINYACYFSEIYRGGIESMPRGQYEAAQILGYSRSQTFIRIILPQVIKRILPSVTNEIITLVKDTSLAFTIGIMEMFTISKALAASQTTMLPYVFAGVFYYIFNFVVAYLLERLEKRLNYYR